MNVDDICFPEQFTFLRFVNEHYLFYSITVLTFVSLFTLVWILQKYTYFEKHGITRASIPTIPYGNFGDVLKRENSLHVFLWRHYNRFKRKGCKFGGLFLFMKPVILITESSDLGAASVNIFPSASKLKKENLDKILSTNILATYVDKFRYSIKGALSEKLIKSEACLVLKDFLLESTCLAFGFQPFEIVDEINELLKQKYAASYKFYLSLCIPLFATRNKLSSDLKEIVSTIMENRKKNDLQENDVIESFIKLFNESNYSIEDITSEVFNVFADLLTYSYSTMILCLYELANNDDVQEGVVGEIRRFNNKHRSFDYENLDELVYLDAVVKETLRKYPPRATIIKVSKDKPNGFQRYPNKDTLIFQSILGLHRDPQFYTKPEAFDPDRFMEKIDLTKGRFIPFGLEPESHLYINFVSLQVTLFLISIFSSLEVKMKDGVTSTFKYNPMLLYLSPCEDFGLSFVRK